MSTAFNKFAALRGLCVLALVFATIGSNASTTARHKAKKPLPPLPTGPTGPVPQIPLDSIKAVAPQVSFQNGQLTIVAPNSSLGDILRAVRKQTGAEIEIPPDASERVVTHLGPGPARDVVADLLNGSRFNYVLVGSPEDAAALTRVVLVAKSGTDAPAKPGQPVIAQAGNNMAPPPQQDGQPAEANDAEAAPDDNSAAPDENADQPAAEAEQEQPGQQGDQPAVKTPQQMLQEMQQRQMQLQQMQQPGQPPVPGSGMPPHPPEQQ